jgi:hypothetical protein
MDTLEGKIFGYLTVKSLHSSGRRGARWNCICKCGKETVQSGHKLKLGRVKSCGCYRDTFRKLAGKEASLRRIYRQYKKNANDRGIIFEIDFDSFSTIIQQNCFYCNAPPASVTKPSHYDDRDPERWIVHNGIDRMDNSKGYIRGNCVPCCPICNFAKRTMSLDQFREWVFKVYKEFFKDIVSKSPAELIDSLITVDIKCFMFQEKMLDTSLSDADRLKTAEIVLELNKKRNRLMRTVDATLGFFDDSVTPKTYLPNEDESDLSAEF